MRRSKEILAGVAVILTVLLVSFLLLTHETERPAARLPGKPGFVATPASPPSPKPILAGQESPEYREREETRLPPAAAVKLRRGGDQISSARLDLLVIDLATRLPVRGARVTATNRATEETVAEQVLPEGRGTIDLPTGALRLAVKHPDYRERGLWIEFNSGAGQTSRQVVELLREVQVAGTVRDQSGAPVSGAMIRFPDSSARKAGPIVTGPDGRFICRLTAGQISGTASKGANAVQFSSYVEANPGRNLDIILPINSPAVVFSGRILNAKGEPVEGAVISLRPGESQISLREERSHSVTTEEDGTFAFSVSPCGSAHVTVRSAGAEAFEETVSLMADLRRDFTVTSHASFSVTLLTPEGKALSKGFRVVGVGSSISKLHSADGRYYSTSYPVDIQAIAAELGYGNSEVAQLNAYEPEVTLRIEPGGHLRGRVVDRNSQPVRRFSYVLLQGRSLYLFQSLIDSPDGSFSVRHVLPGRYTLRVVGTATTERDITIQAGRDCFVEVLLGQ